MFILPIIEVLCNNKDGEVQNKILHILRHLKNQKAGDIFAENLSKSKFKTFRKDLITVCRMNGLDYSNHLDIFLDLFAKENFETAFEAYTLIMNSVPNKLAEEKLNTLKQKSETIYNNASDLKNDISADLCVFFG